ncbi:hypothetical protein SXCC_01615 [Gluconacetobacter sp. SXCC-1]|nr:hypothetical protein SXCC_01615 [Gluconacetobacter sp. SXCC-1]
MPGRLADNVVHLVVFLSVWRPAGETGRSIRPLQARDGRFASILTY